MFAVLGCKYARVGLPAAVNEPVNSLINFRMTSALYT
jgi:hypothetical protein